MQSKDKVTGLDGGISMANNIRYACDVMWGMEQSDELKLQKLLMLKSLKQREAENSGSIYLEWDFAEMKTDVSYVTGITGYDEWKMKNGSRKLGFTGEEAVDEKPKLKSKLMKRSVS